MYLSRILGPLCENTNHFSGSEHTILRRINAPDAEADNEPLSLADFNETYWVHSGILKQ